jgi:hypothetical protein
MSKSHRLHSQCLRSSKAGVSGSRCSGQPPQGSQTRVKKSSQAKTGRVIFRPMTSEEFHALVEEYTDPSASDDGDTPLTLARLAELERYKGIKFPAFYKEFLSMYGAGDFGYVTVLSPDVDSKFPIWETATQLENRECSFMGVIELDSDYFGFLIEQGSARMTYGELIMNSDMR